MGLSIVLYNHNKQSNSTKRPTGGDTFDCILKGECSVISPRLEFNFGNSTNPSGYNYAYIGDFNRYYYIANWTWSGGLWVAELSVDVLATWKDSIGSSSLYVLRSASSSDGYIVDGMYPTSKDVTYASEVANIDWYNLLQLGTYVVGVIGKSGLVKYYALTSGMFGDFANWLFSDPAWMGIDTGEISADLQKALFNPFQYVVSCKWFPFDITGDNVGSLDFGWWTAPISCMSISNLNFVYTSDYTIDLPKHPQAASRGKFLNSSLYSEYKLSFYPFGLITIDGDKLLNSNKVVLSVIVDVVSGSGRLNIQGVNSGQGYALLTAIPAVVGVPIEISQTTTNYLNAVQTGVNGAGSVISNLMGGNIGGAITGGISAIMDTTKAAMPTLETSGSNGGLMGSTQDNDGYITLYAKFSHIVDEDNTHRGRPLCKKVLISSLSGYILVSDGDVSIDGTMTENESITSLLQGGFYYE